MDQVAIVTGAARGIGRSCALALAEKGFAVALVDLLGDEAEAVASEIAGSGGTARAYEADVADFARTGEVVGQIARDFGRIDFLLNNAGLSNADGILDITEESFDRAIAVNLKSCFNYIHHAAPIMLANGGGRIVSMSSLNALSGGVTAAISKFAYSAAKAGILGMTRSLAKELGPTVTVNAIVPGVIRTDVEETIGQTSAEDVVRGIALGRLGRPEDISSVVGFLATNEPNFMTGHTLVIDGFQFNM